MSGREFDAEVSVVRLRQRREFLAAARGARVNREAFVLQVLPRPEPERAGTIGVGFTVTRKIGNAVVRNRARRRLREAARLVLPGEAAPAHDYVVVARSGALTQPFLGLKGDLALAFARATRRRSG